MTVGKSWAARLIVGVSLLAIAAPAIPSETVSYSYDARGRLVKVVHSGTVNNGVASDYSYDKADNRTNVAVTAGGPAVPSFSINDVTVTEGTALAFQISKNGATSDTLTVDIATTDNTAIAGSDYTAVASTLTFLPTETSKTVNVATVNNGTVDGTRAFYANLTNASAGSTISDSQGVGTINDDDVAVIPSFKVNNDSASEGGTVVFTITKTGTTSSSFSVNYATANQTAAAGADYTAKSGTLTFASTDATKTVSVPTIEDSIDEPNETFALNLSGATGGATISDSLGVGTINDDDTAPTGVSFAINNISVAEGGNLVFTVTKTGTTSSSFTVNYATADGTAVQPADYTAASGTLSFTAAATTRTVSVSTKLDFRTNESNETMVVNLSGASGTSTISDAQGVGTIINEDCPDPNTC
jgi:YD repeat-containing protein